MSVLFSGSHTIVICVKCLIELKHDYDEVGKGVGVFILMQGALSAYNQLFI